MVQLQLKLYCESQLLFCVGHLWHLGSNLHTCCNLCAATYSCRTHHCVVILSLCMVLILAVTLNSLLVVVCLWVMAFVSDNLDIITSLSSGWVMQGGMTTTSFTSKGVWITGSTGDKGSKGVLGSCWWSSKSILW